MKAEFSRPIQLTHQTWSDSQTLEDMRLYLSTPTSYHTNSSNGWSLRVKSAVFLFLGWSIMNDLNDLLFMEKKLGTVSVTEFNVMTTSTCS